MTYPSTIRRSSWSSAASESESSPSPTHPRPYLVEAILLAKRGAMLCGLQGEGSNGNFVLNPNKIIAPKRSLRKCSSWRFSSNLPITTAFAEELPWKSRGTQNAILGVPQLRPKSKLFRTHQPGVSANLSASSTSCEAVACKADLHRNSSALYDITIWYVTRNIAYFPQFICDKVINVKAKPHQTVAPSHHRTCQYFHKWFLASSFAGHPGRSSF